MEPPLPSIILWSFDLTHPLGMWLGYAYFLEPHNPSWMYASPLQVIFAIIHLYSWMAWMERGTVRVKCLVKEQGIVFLARAQTGTSQCGV